MELRATLSHLLLWSCLEPLSVGLVVTQLTECLILAAGYRTDIAKGERVFWVRIWVAESITCPHQTTAGAPLRGIQLHCGCVTGTSPSCCYSKDAHGSESPVKLPCTPINPLWTQAAAGGLGQGLRCIGAVGQELSDRRLAELKKFLGLARAGSPVSVTPSSVPAVMCGHKPGSSLLPLCHLRFGH